MTCKFMFKTLKSRLEFLKIPGTVNLDLTEVFGYKCFTSYKMTVFWPRCSVYFVLINIFSALSLKFL